MNLLNPEKFAIYALLLIFSTSIILNNNSIAQDDYIEYTSQTEWYKEWVGMKSGDLPSLVDQNFQIIEYVDGLSFPTTIDFVENGILVLQKNDGKIFHINLDGEKSEKPVIDLDVSYKFESGLLGIATKNDDVYLYYTEAENNDGGKIIGNNIYKFQWVDNKLQKPILLKSLPAYEESKIHNGGVMVVGKNDVVYAVIGDQNGVQGRGLLHNQFGPPDDTGVIIPVDSSRSYFTIGIRNSFGLSIDPVTGNLWATENGLSSFDEINLFYPNSNSGWNAHTGPISESRITVIDVPEFFGPLKSQIQLLLTNLYSFFYLGEFYDYQDPQFSWKQTNSPTALAFAPPTFGIYENWLFVGDCNFGNIYKFNLNEERNSLIFENPGLQDLIFNPDDNMEEIHFGKDFGCITDIKFNDNSMYVVSLTGGKIYQVSLKNL